ncbi:MAG: hypothetical protein ABIZ04_17515 [Opitutus sp.]
MPLSSDTLRGFRPDTIRGAAGFFRVGQVQTGTWWLIDPNDAPFFLRAVNGVSAQTDSAHDPVARLRTWGFNALGAGSAPELYDEGLPFVASVNFTQEVSPIRAVGIRLPDVFHPDWENAARLRAAVACPTLADRRDLLGWLTDDALAWGGPDVSGRPTLLQVCLSLEPSFAAYHAAWEFVLARHGGLLSRLAQAWDFALENKGIVRELTRAEQVLTTAGYLRDNTTWTCEFARRYFSATSAAIRSQDAHHLILGARDVLAPSRGMSSDWLSECVSPLVDVTWVHTADVGAAPLGPIIAGNFNWANQSYWHLTPRSRARGVTSVERMLKQGRATLRACVKHPAVVGYAWDAWRDEPGEQPPFARGLVHLNDTEAREHTELLSAVNGRLTALRPFVP